MDALVTQDTRHVDQAFFVKANSKHAFTVERLTNILKPRLHALRGKYLALLVKYRRG